MSESSYSYSENCEIDDIINDIIHSKIDSVERDYNKCYLKLVKKEEKLKEMKERLSEWKTNVYVCHKRIKGLRSQIHGMLYNIKRAKKQCNYAIDHLWDTIKKDPNIRNFDMMNNPDKIYLVHAHGSNRHKLKNFPTHKYNKKVITINSTSCFNFKKRNNKWLTIEEFNDTNIINVVFQRGVKFYPCILKNYQAKYDSIDGECLASWYEYYYYIYVTYGNDHKSIIKNKCVIYPEKSDYEHILNPILEERNLKYL